MDTLNQGKEDKNKDIIENNNKNNSGNRNTKSAQFKVAFITQAAVIAALYVVLVIMFNYCSFGPIQFRIAEATYNSAIFYTSGDTGIVRRLSVI